MIAIFFLGIILVIVSVVGGLDLKTIAGFFNEDEAYGELITYTTTQDIHEVNFSFEERHIYVSFSDSDEIQFAYYAHENDRWSFDNQDGILAITQKKQFNLLNNITFKYTSKEVKTVIITLPLDMIHTINIRTNVGSVDLNGANQSFDYVNISTDTGSIKAYDFESLETRLRTKTGSIDIQRTQLETVYLSSSTGNISVGHMHANDLDVRNSTGNVTISQSNVLTTIKVTCSTGKVRLLETTAEAYDLKTSTGSISFTNTNMSEVEIKYDLRVSTGTIRINGLSQGNRYTTAQGTVTLKAETSTGKIDITTE